MLRLLRSRLQILCFFACNGFLLIFQLLFIIPFLRVPECEKKIL
jgi:hypothetical protein